MNTDTSNINFQLAADFINYTNRAVFLTGKAGTGKTTFLKYIREHTIKQTAVVAPTGVAAINAGGATIHSFFQLPFTPYIPESAGYNNGQAMDKHHMLGRIRMNTERRKVLQQLELLIIDEISMVRADVLDAIDAVLRHFRSNYHEPFGGVQVLFIGDMFQLPPVLPDEEKSILNQYYQTPFFFSSRVMQQQPAAYVELDKIYRQRDETFIHLLNMVRNNNIDDEGLNLLHRHHDPYFHPSKNDGYITLTTHNYKADQINNNELNELKGAMHSFKAIVEGEFYEKSFPADELLNLKVGAQVMFIKNDMDKAKRYYNGKIGTIEKIEQDKIFVQCGDEPTMIEVKTEIWKNIRYSLNRETQKVEENEIGSFTQYPLRLAWAITIHKSQGLTFEKAIVDAGQSFAAGQVYVALSRCTSLKGLVLLSRITPASLHTDEHILAFAKQSEKASLPNELLLDKKLYQSKIILGLFDLSEAMTKVAAVLRDVDGQLDSYNEEALPWIKEVQTIIDNLQAVAKKFELQLQQLLQSDALPEINTPLQDRIKKAAAYFDDELSRLVSHLPSSPAVTDSRQNALAYNEDLRELFLHLATKKHLIASSRKGFLMDYYQQQKKNFKPPVFTANAYAGATYRKVESKHPVLHKQLRTLRDEICNSANLPLYIVAGSATIDEMANHLPQTPEQLKMISGFGDAKIAKYGKQFLSVITKYCEDNGLEAAMEGIEIKRTRKAATEPKQPKTDTKLESYTLYKEGKTIAEISSLRNLAQQTIEGHLSHYISTGAIDIEQLVSREKIILIEPALEGWEARTSITTIREKIKADISYGEIRMVIAWKEFEQKAKSE